MDIGTRYRERALTTSRSAEVMKKLYETESFNRHGAPEKFSADQGFCRPILYGFLQIDKIPLRPRPSSSSNKSGKIERNSEVFKSVVERMEKADPNANPATTIARSSLLTNLFRGSKILSAFQL